MDPWNQAVRDFLASDCDYLWSCHNDIEFQPGTLKRLLSWDKPLVTALMFMRQGPIVPHVWAGKPPDSPDEPGYMTHFRDTCQWFLDGHEDAIKFGSQVIEPRPDDALIRVDFTSTGCTLMHRDVLAAMEDPWFRRDTGDFRHQGEDRYFFEKARAAGFDAYVDRSCIAGHMAFNVSVGVIDFMTWLTAVDPDARVSPVVTSNMGVKE
jgi:hypothetical protein